MYTSEFWKEILWKKSPNRKKTIQQLTSQNIIEQIWDLAYNTLAEFLEKLAQNLPPYQHQIQQASEEIREARRISEPFMQGNTKHEYEFNIENNTITQFITKLTKKSDQEIQLFLNNLGEKIQKDGEADQKRGRKQLSTALYSCANILLKITKN